jgi:hypothetical protein
MDQNLQDIQREIDLIKERNKRVEMDKTWETSWTRKVLIAVITYLLIVIFMLVAKLEKPFIGAIIPTTAYLLSMSTLPYFKKWWIKKMINDK